MVTFIKCIIICIYSFGVHIIDHRKGIDPEKTQWKVRWFTSLMMRGR